MWHSVLVCVFLIPAGNSGPVFNENYPHIADLVNGNEGYENYNYMNGKNSIGKTSSESDIDGGKKVNYLFSNDLADLFKKYKAMYRNNVRRQLRKKEKKKKTKPTDSDVEVTTPTWQQEWKKKILSEMEQNRNRTVQKGDHVNMAAARPWGRPCGDPEQYPAPWGSCVLAIECESEYRIYRGDHYCGRTEFVCCTLQVSAFDIVHEIEPHLDTDLSSSDDGSKETASERQARERLQEKRRRRRMRKKRKKAMKKKIKSLMRSMERKLKEMSHDNIGKFKENQKNMQKQLKEEKETMRREREEQMLKFSENMDNQEKKMMHDMEEKFAHITSELGSYNKNTSDVRRHKSRRTPLDYIQYDVEYGLLY